MTDRANEASPQTYARAAGVLYLLIVPGDAATTIAHISASLQQWRISVAAEMAMFTCDIPLAVIFYILLRPVNGNLALLAAFFRFAEAVIGCAIVTLHAAPMVLLNGSAYFRSLDAQTLQSLGMLAIKLYDYGFGIALVSFGFHCLLLGYLIYRSTYLPKIIGALLAMVGVCYVLNSFALIAAPGAANYTFIAMLISGFPAEIGLCLWLIFFGVNATRWKAVLLANNT